MTLEARNALRKTKSWPSVRACKDPEETGKCFWRNACDDLLIGSYLKKKTFLWTPVRTSISQKGGRKRIEVPLGR